jgi:hypothetical protein
MGVIAIHFGFAAIYKRRSKIYQPEGRAFYTSGGKGEGRE